MFLETLFLILAPGIHPKNDVRTPELIPSLYPKNLSPPKTPARRNCWSCKNPSSLFYPVDASSIFSARKEFSRQPVERPSASLRCSSSFSKQERCVEWTPSAFTLACASLPYLWPRALSSSPFLSIPSSPCLIHSFSPGLSVGLKAAATKT